MCARAHRVEELRILGGFHRDLRVEHEVARAAARAAPSARSVRGGGRVNASSRLVSARRVGRSQVRERDRIEVVVGEHDEAEAARRSSTISVTTSSTPRWRGFWPSVRHTEQNEQCFGQPRTVCTEPHMYLSAGSRSQRAGRNASPSMRPPSYSGCGAPASAIGEHRWPRRGRRRRSHDRVRPAVLAHFVREQRRVNAAVTRRTRHARARARPT